MRARTSFVTLLLVTSLLLAPVSLAAPSGHVGFSWFSQVKAFVVDAFDFFSFDDGPKRSLAPANQDGLESQRSFVCDEFGASPDPGGC